MPHLTYTTSPTHLVAHDDHLLIVQKLTTWTNKELVVSPTTTKYANAVVYGESSAYNVVGGQVTQDGAALTNAIKSVWSGMGKTSWTTGKRGVFSYYARGGGSYLMEIGRPSNRGMEIGQSRVLLRFRCFNFPIAQCSSFSAYLRIWCGSSGFSSPEAANMHIMSPKWSYNNVHWVNVRIGDGDMSPSDIDTPTGTFSILDHSCEGRVSGTTGDGTQNGARLLDCWDSDDLSYNAQRNVVVYTRDAAGAAEFAEYHSDFQLSGTLLSEMKSQINSTGEVWIGMGFAPSNGFGQSTSGGSSLAVAATWTGYFQRAELIFRASMTRTNYT